MSEQPDQRSADSLPPVNGGASRCKQADPRWQLIEGHLSAIRKMVKSAWKQLPQAARWRIGDFEDAYQAALVALHKAAGVYDPTRGNFEDFARSVIEQTLSKESVEGGLMPVPHSSYDRGAAVPRVRTGWGEEKQKGECNGEVEGQGCRLHDPTERAPDRAETEELNHAILLQALDKLPDRHRQVVERMFGLNGQEGQTQAEIAEDLGITQPRVSQILQEALEEMRRVNLAILMPILLIFSLGWGKDSSRATPQHPPAHHVGLRAVFLGFQSGDRHHLLPARKEGRGMSEYFTVSEAAQEISDRYGVSVPPKRISDSLYWRILDVRFYPLMGRTRLIPKDRIGEIEVALRRKGWLPTAPASV